MTTKEKLVERMVKSLPTIVNALDRQAFSPLTDIEDKIRIKKLSDDLNSLYNKMVVGE